MFSISEYDNVKIENLLNIKKKRFKNKIVKLFGSSDKIKFSVLLLKIVLIIIFPVV